MREHLRSIITGIAGGAIACIVAIAPWEASAAAGACSHPPATLGHFTRAESPDPAPKDSFTGEDGKQQTLADFRGSGLVVNFWATWCAPCVKEMPALDGLAKQLKSRDVVVLALSSDREGAPVVRRFFDRNGLVHLPVSIDGMSKLGHDLEVEGLPTTVFFDANGRQVGRVVGAADWDAPATVEFIVSCLGPTA